VGEEVALLDGEEDGDGESEGVAVSLPCGHRKEPERMRNVPLEVKMCWVRLPEVKTAPPVALTTPEK
jgi:hypothetical protein